MENKGVVGEKLSFREFVPLLGFCKNPISYFLQQNFTKADVYKKPMLPKVVIFFLTF